MKILKRVSAIAISLCMLLSGCSQESDIRDTNISSTASIEDQSQEKLKVVATTFPIYSWMDAIIGDASSNIELIWLVDTGVDLHSFQPTTQDIATISTADMFVYNGGDSDEWVKEVLSQAQNEDMKVLNLMALLGDNVVAEETIEGMQNVEHNHDHGDEEAHEHDEHDHSDEEAHEHDEHDHSDEEAHEHDEHDHSDEETHEHDHTDEDSTEHSEVHLHDGEIVYDEHIWMSLENASELCDHITSALQELDEENSDAYLANVTEYTAKLQTLDEEYETLVEMASRDTILVADRFPFRYLVDDYDISYYAAFPGCSAETEASFETIAFLSEKIKELDISNVVIIDGAAEDIASTIISASGVSSEIVVLNSMQSVTAGDLESDVTYISIMQDNLEILQTVLN